MGLVGIAVFIFFMIIIVVNVKKTSESSMSILLRIMTNYCTDFDYTQFLSALAILIY